MEEVPYPHDGRDKPDCPCRVLAGAPAMVDIAEQGQQQVGEYLGPLHKPPELDVDHGQHEQGGPDTGSSKDTPGAVKQERGQQRNRDLETDQGIGAAPAEYQVHQVLPQPADVAKRGAECRVGENLAVNDPAGLKQGAAIGQVPERVVIAHRENNEDGNQQKEAGSDKPLLHYVSTLGG